MSQRNALRQQGQKSYSETVEKARGEAQHKIGEARATVATLKKQASAQLTQDAQRLADLIVERAIDRQEGAH
jgi:F0F1-type ATP synthase membrane subunit b/b'